jgi:hypothetical protein
MIQVRKQVKIQVKKWGNKIKRRKRERMKNDEPQCVITIWCFRTRTTLLRTTLLLLLLLLLQYMYSMHRYLGHPTTIPIVEIDDQVMNLYFELFGFYLLNNESKEMD